MVPYAPPVSDMRFVLEEVAGLASIASLPGYEVATPDTVAAVLDQAADLAPRRARAAQRQRRSRGGTAGEWRRARAGRVSRRLSDLRRRRLGRPAVFRGYGGQGLPLAVAAAVSEMWSAANLGFALCPMLTMGAVEALEHHGTEELKTLYLPRLVSGEWTGTMNLTEPQAGSDVGALKTRAVKHGDHYRITGQKIFITYGDHDLAENIIHLVLARTPDSPPGTHGISLFLVPKFLPDADGAPGRRNDVRCVSLEHKLGIHASPTAVLAFGDEEGAIGFLVGEEHRGMECMFTMMNNARLNVGLQGVAISERAYQQALEYARTRVQGVPVGRDRRCADRLSSRRTRMLLLMRARIEAMRALAYLTAATIDRAKARPMPAREKSGRAPICWCRW